MPVTSKLNEPLLPIGVVSTLAGLDESLRCAVPTIGKPAAATPVTVLVATVGVVGSEDKPPPEPPLPQPASIRLIVDKHITIKPISFFFIFSPFFVDTHSLRILGSRYEWVGFTALFVMFSPSRNKA
jgi:hypothetical protein